ncbi:unnamed protein product [Blepharisma stoltei]|uniref:Uncharacterized protein n=1 Tax=Blepharisma stoltei TaxID=1481888 RepID=A0AAU9JNW2_9CILI|nr:unnamed protein product [Blepharisma stoltei]
MSGQLNSFHIMSTTDFGVYSLYRIGTLRNWPNTVPQRIRSQTLMEHHSIFFLLSLCILVIDKDYKFLQKKGENILLKMISPIASLIQFRSYYALLRA